MPIGLNIFACFKLSFQEEEVDYSHNDLNERDTVSANDGSKGDQFGARTCKKDFNGRRGKRDGM